MADVICRLHERVLFRHVPVQAWNRGHVRSLFPAHGAPFRQASGIHDHSSDAIAPNNGCIPKNKLPQFTRCGDVEKAWSGITARRLRTSSRKSRDANENLVEF